MRVERVCWVEPRGEVKWVNKKLSLREKSTLPRFPAPSLESFSFFIPFFLDKNKRRKENKRSDGEPMERTETKTKR